MSRLYSGNLNGLNSAIARLQRLGCRVNHSVWHDDLTMQERIAFCIRLNMTTDEIIGEQAFGHYDINVSYNRATEWLAHLADQLEYWK